MAVNALVKPRFARHITHSVPKCGVSRADHTGPILMIPCRHAQTRNAKAAESETPGRKLSKAGFMGKRNQWRIPRHRISVRLIHWHRLESRVRWEGKRWRQQPDKCSPSGNLSWDP